MNEIIIWLRVPITLMFTFLLTRFIYSLFSRKEAQKIINKKENIETIVNQNKTWSSPLFNNAGFVMGILSLFLATSLAFTTTKNPDYIWAEIVIILIGLFMIWTTPVIHLNKELIDFQPLLLNILFLRFLKKVIYYNDIRKVTKITIMNPFIMLKISTRKNINYKLNTAGFNSEIGNALYEIIQEKSKEKN